MNKSKPAFRDSAKFNAKPWVILASIIVVLGLAYLGLRPIRHRLSDQYLEKGEQKLAEEKYVDAIVEFRKSDWLESGKADAAIALSNEMQQEVTAGEIYFRKYQNLEMLEGLTQAKKIPESESIGLRKVKALIEGKHPQLAEVAANILIEMDDRNAKVWAYLGISRLESSRLVQMTAANLRLKLEAAKQAFDKAIELDPEDKISKEYLEEINRQLK